MDKLDSMTENELELFSEINHDSIVRYFDHFHKKIGEEYQTFLITEYCEVCRYIRLFNHSNRLKMILTRLRTAI